MVVVATCGRAGTVLTMTRRNHSPESIQAMLANTRDATDAEQAYARDAFRAGETILYCRGPGWPVIGLHSPEQWEQRDALSRRAN